MLIPRSELFQAFPSHVEQNPASLSWHTGPHGLATGFPSTPVSCHSPLCSLHISHINLAAPLYTKYILHRGLQTCSPCPKLSSHIFPWFSCSVHSDFICSSVTSSGSPFLTTYHHSQYLLTHIYFLSLHSSLSDLLSYFYLLFTIIFPAPGTVLGTW